MMMMMRRKMRRKMMVQSIDSWLNLISKQCQSLRSSSWVVCVLNDLNFLPSTAVQQQKQLLYPRTVLRLVLRQQQQQQQKQRLTVFFPILLNWCRFGCFEQLLSRYFLSSLLLNIENRRRMSIVNQNTTDALGSGGVGGVGGGDGGGNNGGRNDDDGGSGKNRNDGRKDEKKEKNDGEIVVDDEKIKEEKVKELKNAKRSLRREIDARLVTLTLDEVKRQSAKVHSRLFSSNEYRNASRIGLYLSLPSGEITTQEILEQAFRDGKQIFVPSYDFRTRQMEFYEIKSMKEYEDLPVEPKYKIKQPELQIQLVGLKHWRPEGWICCCVLAFVSPLMANVLAMVEDILTLGSIECRAWRVLQNRKPSLWHWHHKSSMIYRFMSGTSS